MGWADRLLDAGLTPPSGNFIPFDFEDVRKTIEKKGTAFGFADADGTFIQERGHTGNRYPMRAIFWGENYDLAADAFDKILLEPGIFKLDHPKYGTVDVVPFGPITRRDDLKTAANQAIIELTFWETTGLLFPNGQTDPAAAVLSAVDEYNDAIAAEFASTLSLESTFEEVTLQSQYTALLDAAEGGLQPLADTQSDVQKQFNAIVDSINRSIDVLISDPLTLAFQTAIMAQSPARALTSIQARLSAYSDLAASIITGEGAVAPGEGGGAGTQTAQANAFHTKDLFASTYVSASVLSTVNNQFTTKTDALAAAQAVLEQMDDVTNWRDDNYTVLAASAASSPSGTTVADVDTGGSYQQLQEAVALCVGFLVEISFSLKQERRIILDRDRTFVDLSAELYGQTDEIYDFFIASNDLSGDEYFDLKKGREVVYYV